jgi:hypothetical protein
VTKAACLDDSEGKLEEVVLIFGNSDHEQTDRVIRPALLPPTIWASNFACGGWSGSHTTIVETESWTLTYDLNVSFDGIPMEALPGGFGFTALAATNYTTAGATFHYQFEGSDEKCTYSGSGDLGFDPANSFLITSNYVESGVWHRAYSGQVDSDGLAVMHVDCIEGSTTQEGPLRALIGTIQPDGLTPFYVEDSGKVFSGASETLDGGTFMEWSFTAD